PYLYVAGVLAAGLDGVERGVEAPSPLSVDPAEKGEAELEALGVKPLPRSLGEAIEFASRSGWLRRVLGAELVDEYLRVRRSEWEAYANHVCEWETKAYLDAF
ncbi:MAG: type III glutamate--ammonia ligase, partial [Thermoprotei archaeon]